MQVRKLSYEELSKANPGVRLASKITFRWKLTCENPEERAKFFVVNGRLVSVAAINHSSDREETCYQWYSWDPVFYEWTESHIEFGDVRLKEMEAFSDKKTA